MLSTTWEPTVFHREKRVLSNTNAPQLCDGVLARSEPVAETDSPAYFNLPRRSRPAVAQRGIFG